MDELSCFLRGELEPGRFTHREHVRMAHQLLSRHGFTEAALHYSTALRLMSGRAGQPQAFNQTVTLAFLALVVQRMEACGTADFESFVAMSPELFDRNLLSRWYRPEQLASPLARRAFLLPDPQR